MQLRAKGAEFQLDNGSFEQLNETNDFSKSGLLTVDKILVVYWLSQPVL